MLTYLYRMIYFMNKSKNTIWYQFFGNFSFTAVMMFYYSRISSNSLRVFDVGLRKTQISSCMAKAE